MRSYSLLAFVVFAALLTAFPVCGSEVAEGPGTEDIYDDQGDIYSCSANATTGGYHCQQCRLIFPASGPQTQCIDIDGTGGSGYFDCVNYGSRCDLSSGCNVTIVTP